MIALINLFEANKIARFDKYLAKSSDWDSLMLQAMWHVYFHVIYTTSGNLGCLFYVWKICIPFHQYWHRRQDTIWICSGIILWMRPGNERQRHYKVVIGWAHAQNDPCMFMMVKISNAWCNMIIFLQIDCFQTKRKTGEGKTGEETRLREKENQEEALIQVQFNL